MKINAFAVAAVAGLVAYLSIGAAKADVITLGGAGENPSWNFTGLGNGELTMLAPEQRSISAQIGGVPGASIFIFGNSLYTLSGLSGGTFTSVAQDAPINPQTMTVNVEFGAIEVLVGDLKWTSLIQDSLTAATLAGTLTIQFSGDSLASEFPQGFNAPVTLEFATDPNPTFPQLANTNETQFQHFLAGAIQPVPGPIVGAGLPGLVAALGGLVATARRRRKQLA